MAEWRILYEAAVDEANPGVFERLVYETEDAICWRLRELSGNMSDPLEVNEISEAAKNILKLKIERLGWPNPNSLPRP